VGDENPGRGGGDGRLETLGETTATTEPTEGSLDHPPAQQKHEAFGGAGSFDDLGGPLADGGQVVAKLAAGDKAHRRRRGAAKDRGSGWRPGHRRPRRDPEYRRFEPQGRPVSLEYR
jgi:hypothetical protein